MGNFSVKDKICEDLEQNKGGFSAIYTRISIKGMVKGRVLQSVKAN